MRHKHFCPWLFNKHREAPAYYGRRRTTALKQPVSQNPGNSRRSLAHWFAHHSNHSSTVHHSNLEVRQGPSLWLQPCTGGNCGAQSQGNTTFNYSPIPQSTNTSIRAHCAPARHSRRHNKLEGFCASRSLLSFSRKYMCPRFPFQSIKEIEPLTGHSSNGKRKENNLHG